MKMREYNSGMLEHPLDALCRRLKRMVTIASRAEPHGKHRVRAELWRPVGDEFVMISHGKNSSRSSDLSTLYARNENVVGTCAEVEAVLQALNKHETVSGCVMLVARAKKTRRGGDVVSGNAEPCSGCKQLLMDFGLAYALHTEEAGDTSPGYQLTYYNTPKKETLGWD